MKKIVSFGAVLLCGIVTLNTNVVSASAETTTNSTVEHEGEPKSSILISNYSFTASASANTLYITPQVFAVATMAKLGFINFEVQRSSTGTGNWTSVNYSILDKLTEDSDYYSITQYPIYVSGGYYYRVYFEVYAKEKGLILPHTQTIPYTSYGVWVPA